MTFDLSTAHGWLRLAHVVPGFVGLAAFWVPVVAKKGDRMHVAFGRVFAVCTLLVAASALISSVWMLLDPVSFSGEADRSSILRFVGVLLGSLGYLTLVTLVLSVWPVWTRRTPERLAAGWVQAMLVGLYLIGIAVLIEGILRYFDHRTATGLILQFLGVGQLLAARKAQRKLTRPDPPRMHWWYLHMEYMLATGIAFHTAFAVFGLSRLAGSVLTGPWQLVPWIAPSALGVPATTLWIRAYRRKFEPAPVPTGETP